MKKQNKKTNNTMKIIKILTISLLIVLVSMISFLGIYKQNKNQINNSVKDYSYSMGLNGARTISLQVSTENKSIVKDAEGNIVENATDDEINEKGYTTEEVPVNAEEDKTLDNFEKAKQIIENKLNYLKVQEYNVSLNKTTGEISVEIPENSSTDTIVSNLVSIGKFEIIDTETKEVLLDNSNIKSSDVLYNSTTTGTSVYLEIVFNKEGKEKLKDISKTYVKTENENTTTNEIANVTENTDVNESTENQISDNTSETTNKTITMKINDEEVMTTSFDNEMTTGKIQLSVGTATTDTSTLQGYITQAQNVAVALDSGKMPLTYEISKNEYVLSDITEQNLINVQIAVAMAILLGIIILIAKYKLSGLLAGIANIGLVAIYMLLIRYANVIISIESIFGIIIMLALNYIFTIMLLKNVDLKVKEKKENPVNKAILDTYKMFFIRILPICIISVAFCFVEWIPISSFGMISFWGLVLIAVYNVIITKSLLKIKVEDK